MKVKVQQTEKLRVIYPEADHGKVMDLLRAGGWRMSYQGQSNRSSNLLLVAYRNAAPAIYGRRAQAKAAKEVQS